MEQNLNITEAVGVLLNDLQQAHDEAWPTLTKKYVATQGKKYIKIVAEGSQRIVWGFINLSNDKFQYGDILKAASWAAPATNKARGNVFKGYEVLGKQNHMRMYGPDYL